MKTSSIVKNTLNFIKPRDRLLVKETLSNVGLEVIIVPQPEDRLNYFKCIYKYDLSTGNYQSVRQALNFILGSGLAK